MTWTDAINTILDADILVCHGRKPTVEEVWNHDPNGELYMISYWYWLACRILDKPLPPMEDYFREEHERMYQGYLQDPTIKEDITLDPSRITNPSHPWYQERFTDPIVHECVSKLDKVLSNSDRHVQELQGLSGTLDSIKQVTDKIRILLEEE